MLPIIFIVAFVMTMLGVCLLLPWLRFREILDHPNPRSSHSTPTLRGGGIAVTIVIVAIFIFLHSNPLDIASEGIIKINFNLIFSIIILALISWLDDVRGLSQITRLIFHFLAVVIVLMSQPQSWSIFQGSIPLWLDLIIVLIIWVWFINLFNFMDGIDGISGVEVTSVCTGIVLLALMIGWEPIGQVYAVILAGIGFGFLWWNWQPAKVFLGDVGSVPLGFLLGWLLLGLAAEGYWIQALILPLFYLVDSTLTLVVRLSQGGKVWEAHRDHFYQQAVRKGFSHAKIASTITIANVFLVIMGLSALYAPVTSLLGAASIVFVVLLYFKARPGK